jgi:adenylate cyclase
MYHLAQRSMEALMDQNGSTRRLAAVFAADIVAYSRLMGADEAGTLAALRAILDEIVKPVLAAHSGRLVKLMGDGVLAEFTSVVDAVKCAVAIQSDMAERERDMPDNCRIQFRIGINLGDIIIEDDDIFGDGVNLAARLEGLADPGGICVSRTVVTYVGSKAGVAFKPMGPKKVKNISEPIEAFRVVAARAAPFKRRSILSRRLIAAALVFIAITVGTAALLLRPVPSDAILFDEAKVLARPSGPTVAILPFRNLSGDPKQDYISDGISEDIITELGQFRDLNILSSRSTFVYKDRAMDVRRIGEDLGADYVLEGAVRQAGGRLRVTSQLVDTKSGSQVWSEAYDEVMSAKGLFDLQVQITGRVAYEIGGADGAINNIAAGRVRSKPPEKLSSYECSMFQPDSWYDAALQRRIRGCILRVVEEEPDYWRGWGALAAALRTDVLFFKKLYDGTQAEKLERSLAAARKAVFLNPASPRAHYELAIILLVMGDKAGFYASAEDALTLGGDRYVEGDIGRWFVWTGRYDLGAALVRRAIELNPGSVAETWRRALAEAHFVKGEYEAALNEFQQVHQPEIWWSQVLGLAIYSALDRKEGMRQTRAKLLELRPDVTIADAVWLYRRFQRPEADIGKYIEALRAGGLPEGRYRPIATGSDG